jgi:hypothetical protein
MVDFSRTLGHLRRQWRKLTEPCIEGIRGLTFPYSEKKNLEEFMPPILLPAL